MIDIFDEVSDDLRSERAARLARRYGALVATLAVLLVLAVAAQQLWAWHQRTRDAAAANTFLSISQTYEPQGQVLTGPQSATAAQHYVDFAKSAPAGYRALAELRAAGLYADAGQLPAAAALWNTVAADGGAAQTFRDLANLTWAQHELGMAPDDDVAARLSPLAMPDNPYHGLAQETQALLYLKQGKTAQAKGLFMQISADPDAPDGVRNRADGLLAKLNG